MELCTAENTDFFGFDSIILHKCKIVDVYDGDTCTCVLQYPDSNKYFKWKVRLVGYNAPELRPLLSTPNRDAIITQAKIFRDDLKFLTQNKILFLKFYGFDKYGRVLGKLYHNEKDIESINEIIKKKYKLPDYLTKL